MKHAMLSIAASFALLLGLVTIIGTVTTPGAAEMHHTVVRGDAVAWGPAPPSLPPRAEAAVLMGNPGKEGPFVLRLRFPAGFMVPPHRHSKDELLTVMRRPAQEVGRREGRPGRLPSAAAIDRPRVRAVRRHEMITRSTRRRSWPSR